MEFERIHELGAERHREAWLIANRAAATNLWGSGLDISNPDVKRAVSLIILRVLDATRAPSPVPAPEPVRALLQQLQAEKDKAAKVLLAEENKGK